MTSGIYTEEDFIRFRKLEHHKIHPENVVEWVFPNFGEPVLTFYLITYYNGYCDREILTPEQIEILKKEGPLGCPVFN